MIGKLLAAALLVAAPVPASAPDAPLASPVPAVVCPVRGGWSMGTAFRIGPKLLLSVAHVTHYPACYIDGVKIRVLYSSTKQDFSIITDDRVGQFLRVDCGGFVKGHHYIAIGHPRGVSELVPVQLTATGKTEDGQALLVGIFTAQPGHSGGAIIDADTFKVVGTVNTADWEEGVTGSVELKGTPICQRAVVAGRVRQPARGDDEFARLSWRHRP